MKRFFKSTLLIVFQFCIVAANAQNPNWQAPTGYQYSMTITAILDISGDASRDEMDQVAAFVGNSVRGVALPAYEANSDKYFLFLTVFSNQASGENLSFKIYLSLIHI